jgi:ABC-type uncharacterized transport system permease subunit
MVFSAILMSMFYIGGEMAQSRMGLTKSLTGVFQGLLLFTLLACDTLGELPAQTERGQVMDSYALLLGWPRSMRVPFWRMAALGLLINEKVGIVNLGAEGMMLCAAIAGFATVVHTGNDWLGFAAGIAVGAALACHLWFAGDLAKHQPVRNRAGAHAVWHGLLGLCWYLVCAGQDP